MVTRLPSRELTYPTLGKGKSSSKCHFWGYVSSLEGTLPQTHSSLASANRGRSHKEMPSSKFQPVILAGASWGHYLLGIRYLHPSPKKRWISPWLTDDYESQEPHPRHTLITALEYPKKFSSKPSCFPLVFWECIYPNCMPCDTEEISSKPVILVNCGTNYRCMNWKKAGWFSWTEKNAKFKHSLFLLRW